MEGSNPVSFIPAPPRVMLSPDRPDWTSQKAHTVLQAAHAAAFGIASGPLQPGEPGWGLHLGTTAGIEYRLLGAIEVGVNGHVLDIGGQKQRALLAILLGGIAGVFAASAPAATPVH